MSRTRWWMSLLVVLSCLSPVPAIAQNAAPGATADWQAGTDWCERRDGSEWVTDESVIVIDHFQNRVLCPVAMPLKVREGKSVRAIFLRTHPNSFSYEISAIEAPTPRSVAATTGEESVPVPERELTSTSLHLRHDRHFSQYTITIKAVEEEKPVEVEQPAAERQSVEREVLTSLQSLVQADPQELQDAAEEITARAYKIGPFRPELEEMVEEEVTEIQPELGETRIRPLAGDLAGRLEEEVEPPVVLRPFQVTIEVETAGPELTFTSGFAFSDLTDSRFFVAPDDKGTLAPEDDTVNVHKDDRDNDWEPDAMALINMRWPDMKNRFLNKLGVAFGLGLNGDNEPRYFLGPSFMLPKGFVFTFGFSGGDAKVLPAGQGLNRPVINGGTTLPTLESDFKVGLHFGISFAFTDRENDVVSHLSALKAVQSPGQQTTGGGGGDEEEQDEEEQDEEEQDEE